MTWSMNCVPVLPFPLETISADFSDWAAGFDPVRDSHCTVTLWGSCPNYFRLEVFHCGPRALWINRVVNHCQKHLCLSWSRMKWGFSQTLCEITSKCWQISKFAALLEMIYTRRLIIQSMCITQLYSQIKQITKAFSRGGPCFYWEVS